MPLSLLNSTIALSKLYAASSRPSLQQLQVKGDLLLTNENKNVIMTRARARQSPFSSHFSPVLLHALIQYLSTLDPDQFPPIPFPAKALKLLIHEAQNASSQGQGEKAVPDDAESDDGDDEWADEGNEFTAGNDQDLDFLSGSLCFSLLSFQREVC